MPTGMFSSNTKPPIDHEGEKADQQQDIETLWVVGSTLSQTKAILRAFQIPESLFNLHTFFIEADDTAGREDVGRDVCCE